MALPLRGIQEQSNVITRVDDTAENQQVDVVRMMWDDM